MRARRFEITAFLAQKSQGLNAVYGHMQSSLFIDETFLNKLHITGIILHDENVTSATWLERRHELPPLEESKNKMLSRGQLAKSPTAFRRGARRSSYTTRDLCRSVTLNTCSPGPSETATSIAGGRSLWYLIALLMRF